jgi:hypothetical protein
MQMCFMGSLLVCQRKENPKLSCTKQLHSLGSFIKVGCLHGLYLAPKHTFGCAFNVNGTWFWCVLKMFDERLQRQKILVASNIVCIGELVRNWRWNKNFQINVCWSSTLNKLISSTYTLIAFPNLQNWGQNVALMISKSWCT